LDAAFLFFFSSAACEKAIMTSVGFRARGPLSTGTRGGRPTFPAFAVALHDLELVLAAATVDRAAHVMPNRFRCIGEVTGFDFGGGASSGNSWRGRGCGSKLWCIPAGGGVNPNAGYDWWRF
jgi:hypothetical protein